MKDRDLILLMLVAGGAWYLYTRSQGLTLTGAYANPMLLPAGSTNKQSLVTASNTTSALATNPFSALTAAITGIVRTITKPGNASSSPSPSYAISGAQPVGGPSSNYGVPNIGDAQPPYDPSLTDANPWWTWDNTFESPVTGTVPNLDWTLAGPVDYNYIPPPPGA